MIESFYLVAVPKLDGQTHVTFLTMEELLSSTNTAYATAVTVVLVLVFIIKKFTFQTSVLDKKKLFKKTGPLHLILEF
jgi:hypothetical protein